MYWDVNYVLYLDFKKIKKSFLTVFEQITETENKDYALYKENERKKACKFNKYNSIFADCNFTYIYKLFYL